MSPSAEKPLDIPSATENVLISLESCLVVDTKDCDEPSQADPGTISAIEAGLHVGAARRTSENFDEEAQLSSSPCGKRRRQAESRAEEDFHFERRAPEGYPDIQDITLRKHPALTLRCFAQAIYRMMPKKLPWSLPRTYVYMYCSYILWKIHRAGANGDLDLFKSWPLIQSFSLWIESIVLDTIFWIGCGILSTAGLGSGVQTGALFLFPHVCRLALAWSKKQGSMSRPPSLSSLMISVAIPGFLSGGGSAIGELVPFALARVIREAGGDPFALLIPDSQSSSTELSDENNHSLSTQESQTSVHSEKTPSPSESSSSGWTPQLLLANTRSAMEKQLSTNTFLKVFLLAVVPNALFDLAGLVCGAADVSMWTFFMATWTAKALVRTPGQTCGLALAVVAIASPQSLSSTSFSDSAGSAGALESSGFRVYLERYGRVALAKFAGDDEFLLQDEFGADAANSTISKIFFGSVSLLWTGLTVGLFGFFVVSTMEQIAQHHVKTNPDLKVKDDGVEHGMKLETIENAQ